VGQSLEQGVEILRLLGSRHCAAGREAELLPELRVQSGQVLQFLFGQLDIPSAHM
jgi:hypothetical protein